MNVAVFSFGCRANQYDAQVLREQVRAAGHDVVDAGAQVGIINACCVTAKAEKDCRNLVRRLHRRGVRVVVTGCFLPQMLVGLPAEAYPRGSLPRGLAADVVGGIHGFEGHLRAYVKVEDGCEGMCTYCIVPRVRGPVRSRTTAEVVGEMRRLVSRGFSEIVLTGVNLGAYGTDTGQRLEDIVEASLGIEGLRRLRLSSLEPAFITGELLRALANSPSFCPHFHIPLQSGSDRVLRMMARRMSAGGYLRLVERVRKYVPGATVTTDVIVGFPGETEEDVAETCRVIEEVQFLAVHLFPFSPRPGTPAASLPGRVPPDEMSRRKRRVRECARSVRAHVLAGLVGTRQEILAECGKAGVWRGYTAGYVPAEVKARGAMRGQLVPFLVREVRQERLAGDREAGW